MTSKANASQMNSELQYLSVPQFHGRARNADAQKGLRTLEHSQIRTVEHEEKALNDIKVGKIKDAFLRQQRP